MRIFLIHHNPSIDSILIIALPYSKVYCISTEFNSEHVLCYANASLMGTLFLHNTNAKISYDNESLGFFLCITIIPHSITASLYTRFYYCIYTEYSRKQLLYTTNTFSMVNLPRQINIVKIIYDNE